MLLWAAVAHAACPASSSDVAAALDDADGAFAEMSAERLRGAVDRAGDSVDCLAETLPRDVVARLHRAEGLGAFVDGDETRAARAFAAARAIEPAWQLPEAMVPLGHPVRALYDEADPATLTASLVPAPSRGHLTFDGRHVAARPTQAPTVAQWLGDDGGVRASAYLWPEDPLFAYDVPRPRRGPNLPLTVVAGASLAGAAALYAFAADSHAAYYDLPEGDAGRPTLRARTNGLFVASAGAGVLAAGSGVGAVVAGRW